MAEFKYHIKCDKCGSSDGKAVYSDSSTFCWVCKNATLSDEYKEALKENTKVKQFKQIKKENMQFKDESPKNVKPVIDPDVAKQIKSSTSNSGNGFRSIEDETYTYFGVRHAFNEETGEVQEQYYPCTQDGQLTGYKIREVPKNFRSIARTGADCELFGQFRFNRGGKYVLLVEGELDALSAYQMLKDYAKSKNSDFETAVVSPTTGANSKKQVQAQYKFFDTFDNIILAYDNDKAGKEAAEDILKYLPKGKVKVLQMRHKDPNEYLMADDNKNFIQDFYNAKKYIPTGVVASNEISDGMRSEMDIQKIPLPPFMHELQDMMAGGIPLGRIINLGSASGTGKSTIIEELIYFMLFNSPHMVGVVTLESTSGQYGIKLLSRHISRKLELMDNTAALALMNSKDVMEKEHDLFNDSEGNPRFYLVDDRDGDVEDIQAAIENLIISCGCKVVVLDPIHDIIASLPLEEQDKFITWQKGMIKSHLVTFLNVCHTRKTSNGQKAGSVGGDLHEEDLQGNSVLYKSAACNLLFSRNKEAPDEIERNTTVMKATKIRWTGKTGIAGKYYYDNTTHTMWDLKDYMAHNGLDQF